MAAITYSYIFMNIDTMVPVHEEIGLERVAIETGYGFRPPCDGRLPAAVSGLQAPAMALNRVLFTWALRSIMARVRKD